MSLTITVVLRFVDVSSVAKWFSFDDDRINLLLVGAVALILFLVHSAVFGMPLAQNQDEYSYLLLGKTFAAGRLTNPAHPMREFFDNLNIINYPTFTSKYPPAQGLILALGISIFKSAFAGVMLSGVAACMAVFWMLRALFTPKWSFAGAFLTLTHPAFFYWSLGYHFGFAACIGGAITLGALLRLIKTVTAAASLILGVGVAILANSRPFEGLVACVPVMIVLAIWLYAKWKTRPEFRYCLAHGIVPLAAVLTLNFAWMGYYNYRVTGDAFRLPYSVYNEQYDPIPLFLPLLSASRQSADSQGDLMVDNYESTRITRNELMRQFHLHEIDGFLVPQLEKFANNSKSNILLFAAKKAIDNLVGFGGTTWLLYSGVLIVGVVLLFPERRFLFLLGAAAFCFFVVSFATYNQNHYFAPFVGYLALLVTYIFNRARTIYSGARKYVPALVLALVLAQVAVVFTEVAYTQTTSVHRNKLVQTVFEKPLYDISGKHLVVIDFSTGNYTLNSANRYLTITDRTYFNEPDIDESRIVWANSQTVEANSRLFDYFKGRDVWILGFGANKLADGTIEAGTEGTYPKLISCSGTESPYPPDSDLGTRLRQLCPH